MWKMPIFSYFLKTVEICYMPGVAWAVLNTVLWLIQWLGEDLPLGEIVPEGRDEEKHRICSLIWFENQKLFLTLFIFCYKSNFETTTNYNLKKHIESAIKPFKYNLCDYKTAKKVHLKVAYKLCSWKNQARKERI